MSAESIWDDPRITAYVLGELSGDELAEFERQLHSSDELAAAVEDARSVTNQLQGLYATESTPPLEEDRRTAIRAGQSPTALARSAESHPWKVPMLLLATAAVVMLLIGIAPMLRRQNEPTLSQVPQSDESAREAVVAQEREELAAGKSDSAATLTLGATAQPIDAADDATESNDGLASMALREKLAAPAPLAAPQAKSSLEEVDRELSIINGATSADELAEISGPAGGQPLVELSKQVAGGSTMTYQAGREAAGRPLSERKDRDSRIAGAVEAKLAEGIPPSPAAAPASQPADEARDAAGVALGRVPQQGGEAAANRFAFNPADHTDHYFRQLPGKSVDLFEASAHPYGEPDPSGRGPGIAGDKFDPITDNAFKRVAEHPLSTFSVDVDTASYSKTRDFLMRANQLPRPDAVRIEELINYFDYDYQAPANDAEHPFAAQASVTSCPWNPEHRLARIALKGKTMEKAERPPCNLVFLLDTSGSMNAPNKLPLVIEGMQMLVKQLSDKDRVAITVYAGAAGLVLDSTPASKGKKIRKALTQLSAGGSTNGGAGIALAYQTARDNFITEGVNRVILCTDGDFNVGTTGTDALVRMVEQEAKGGIFLSVLGFGMGNHNDAMLEQISGRGNGNYAFIDNKNEAKKVLVEQTSGTLVTIAKDVKLQIEFNPAKVDSYRLIGYENRVLAKEDFNDDQKDAGEIGAGHAVTALYEIVPAGVEADASGPKVDDLRYQTKPETTAAAASDELMTLKLRYKQPDGDTSTLVQFPVSDDGEDFESADADVRFAAAVAGFGMQLRRSQYAGNWTLSEVLSVAQSATGKDRFGLRAEFVELVRKASELMGQQ